MTIAELQTERTWMTPRQCASVLEHETTTCILGAIESGELPALVRRFPTGRVRYKIAAADFQAWLRETWRPTVPSHGVAAWREGTRV